MPKSRPKTGEPRATNQPLKIDRLPPSAHEAIVRLYKAGKTWEEMEALSAQPLDKGGFVDWDKLSTDVLELFPNLRLPHTNLHRWFDLRVRQVSRNVLKSAEQARVIAEAFVSANVEGDREGVLNAARDLIMGVISEDGSFEARIGAAKALTALGKIMQTARTNDVRERTVAVDERKLVQMEKDAELKRKRFQREMDAAEKKVTKGEALTVADINKIRERVFGIGPAPAAANG